MSTEMTNIIAAFNAAYPTPFGVQPVYRDVTIASGQTTSNVIDLLGLTPVAVITPSALTGTSFTFSNRTSPSGTAKVFTDPSTGAAISVAASADDHIPVPPVVQVGARYLSLTSNAAEGAARTITLACVPVTSAVR